MKHQKAAFYSQVGRPIGLLDAVSSRLSRPVVERIFSTPKKYKISKDEKAYLDEAVPLKIPFEGSKLSAWRFGSGPCALLVHGWSGRGTQFIQLVQSLRENGFSALVVDFPAHGDSPGKTATLLRFIEALKVVTSFHGPFEIAIGHSLGALAVAAMQSESLFASQVVLVSPTPGVTHAMEYFQKVSGIKREIIWGMMDDFSNRHTVDLARYEFERLAMRLPEKTLVIYDLEDRMVPFEKTRTWLSKYPWLERHETEGLGHMRILQSGEVIERIISFVERPSTHIQQSMLSEFAL